MASNDDREQKFKGNELYNHPLYKRGFEICEQNDPNTIDKKKSQISIHQKKLASMESILPTTEENFLKAAEREDVHKENNKSVKRDQSKENGEIIHKSNRSYHNNSLAPSRSSVKLSRSSTSASYVPRHDQNKRYRSSFHSHLKNDVSRKSVDSHRRHHQKSYKSSERRESPNRRKNTLKEPDVKDRLERKEQREGTNDRRTHSKVQFSPSRPSSSSHHRREPLSSKKNPALNVSHSRHVLYSPRRNKHSPTKRVNKYEISERNKSPKSIERVKYKTLNSTKRGRSREPNAPRTSFRKRYQDSHNSPRKEKSPRRIAYGKSAHNVSQNSSFDSRISVYEEARSISKTITQNRKEISSVRTELRRSGDKILDDKKTALTPDKGMISKGSSRFSTYQSKRSYHNDYSAQSRSRSVTSATHVSHRDKHKTYRFSFDSHLKSDVSRRVVDSHREHHHKSNRASDRHESLNRRMHILEKSNVKEGFEGKDKRDGAKERKTDSKVRHSPSRQSSSSHHHHDHSSTRKRRYRRDSHNSPRKEKYSKRRCHEIPVYHVSQSSFPHSCASIYEGAKSTSKMVRNKEEISNDTTELKRPSNRLRDEKKVSITSDKENHYSKGSAHGSTHQSKRSYHKDCSAPSRSSVVLSRSSTSASYVPRHDQNKRYRSSFHSHLKNYVSRRADDSRREHRQKSEKASDRRESPKKRSSHLYHRSDSSVKSSNLKISSEKLCDEMVTAITLDKVMISNGVSHEAREDHFYVRPDDNENKKEGHEVSENITDQSVISGIETSNETMEKLFSSSSLNANEKRNLQKSEKPTSELEPTTVSSREIFKETTAPELPTPLPASSRNLAESNAAHEIIVLMRKLEFFEDPVLFEAVADAEDDEECSRTKPYRNKTIEEKIRTIRPPPKKRSQMRRLSSFAGEGASVSHTRSGFNTRSTAELRSFKITPKIVRARSSIHGWGVYANAIINEHELVSEYIGEIIRTKICDIREKKYEKKGMSSSYFFKIDDNFVIDGTKKGNISRFINHSCEPNCYTKIKYIGGSPRVLIYSSKQISKGDEITYDYKFPIEDVKIACLCGQKKCQKFLN